MTEESLRVLQSAMKSAPGESDPISLDTELA